MLLQFSPIHTELIMYRACAVSVLFYFHSNLLIISSCLFCSLFLCVMDHCYTARPHLQKAAESDKNKPMNTVVVRAQAATEAFYPNGVSEITLWLCMFLRSVFKNNTFVEANNCTNDCITCQSMIDHIKTCCHNVHLDSRCLEIHKEHMLKYGFQTKLTTRFNKLDIILAHYHPEGIFFRIFPLIEGTVSFWPFQCLKLVIRQNHI